MQLSRSSGAMLLIWAAALGLSALPASADEPPAFAFSTDPITSAEQHAAYEAVHRYEQYLNAGNTQGIVDLFAPESVAEWNDKPTFATRQQKIAGYDALFRIAKFTTVFGYASIDIYGDTAVVRTFHHRAASVLENGKKVTDFNREVFILRKIDGAYKIVFYMFNTDPVQGEG
jgi:ketosteroid isomerase-like protein